MSQAMTAATTREREITDSAGAISRDIDGLHQRLSDLLVRLRGSVPEKVPGGPTPVANSLQSLLHATRATLDHCSERVNEIDGLV